MRSVGRRLWRPGRAVYALVTLVGGLAFGREWFERADAFEVALSVDVPPQVARHEGYETAFLDMPSFELA